MKPTPEQIRSIFSYDKETGAITQRGKPAGYLMKTGHRLLSYFKTRLYAHQVAWCLVNGEWPTAEIDHINGNKSVR